MKTLRLLLCLFPFSDRRKDESSTQTRSTPPVVQRHRGQMFPPHLLKGSKFRGRKLLPSIHYTFYNVWYVFVTLILHLPAGAGRWETPLGWLWLAQGWCASLGTRCSQMPWSGQSARQALPKSRSRLPRQGRVQRGATRHTGLKQLNCIQHIHGAFHITVLWDKPQRNGRYHFCCSDGEWSYCILPCVMGTFLPKLLRMQITHGYNSPVYNVHKSVRTHYTQQIMVLVQGHIIGKWQSQVSRPTL